LSRHVICLHGGNRYALPLSAVRRVAELSPLARVPRSPPGLLGVMNLAGRVACVIDLGPLVGLRARPARPDGRVVMLQRARGDLGIYVSEVAGIELVEEDGAQALTELQGAAVAEVARPEGPLKLIDPELLQRGIDTLVEPLAPR
jgi:chemotaxis signal transduction protein